MRTRWALLLLGLAALGSGCGDDGGTGVPRGDPIAYPLAVGSKWVYQTTFSSSRGGATDSSEIIRTDTVDGETYSVLESRDEFGASEVLLRQAGQELLVILSDAFTTTSRLGDSVTAWLNRVLDEASPLKYGDFAASSRTRWTIAEAETSFVIGRGEVPVSFLLEGESNGRVSVAVPAGTYGDVYEGEIRATIDAGSFGSDLSTQTLWVADGVGLVKQMGVDVSVDSKGTSTDTFTSELTRVELP